MKCICVCVCVCVCVYIYIYIYLDKPSKQLTLQFLSGNRRLHGANGELPRNGAYILMEKTRKFSLNKKCHIMYKCAYESAP